MNIKATLETSQSFYLKAFLGQTARPGKNTAATLIPEQALHDKKSLSMSLVFNSKAEVSFQARKIEKFFDTRCTLRKVCV